MKPTRINHIWSADAIILCLLGMTAVSMAQDKDDEPTEEPEEVKKEENRRRNYDGKWSWESSSPMPPSTPMSRSGT